MMELFLRRVMSPAVTGRKGTDAQYECLYVCPSVRTALWRSICISVQR